MDNYRLTAERMYDSSKILHEKQHFFNACYLAGYVGECYAKLLYRVIVLQDPNRTHNSAAILSNPAFMSTLPSSPHNRYSIDFANICPQMSGRWNPIYRYSDTHSWDSTTSLAFQQEAELIFDKIIEMLVDGVI